MNPFDKEMLEEIFKEENPSMEDLEKLLTLIPRVNNRNEYSDEIRSLVILEYPELFVWI